MRKKNLRLTSPQLCPQFLVGQGEYSSLRPRHAWVVGEDVLSTVKPFTCTCQYSFSFFFSSPKLFIGKILENVLFPKSAFLKQIHTWGLGIRRSNTGQESWRHPEGYSSGDLGQGNTEPTMLEKNPGVCKKPLLTKHQSTWKFWRDLYNEGSG